MSDATATALSFKRVAAAHARDRSGAVSIWIWSLAALVFLMVFLGGATRLTESGLSITEWKPVAGVIPPLTHSAWLDAFAKYKQIPQYSAMFPDMALGHFQAIFLMEWFHRLVGRALGFALLVPFVVFWLKGKLTPTLKLQMLAIFALGALQGFVGWWMVSSGLKDRIEVAQERLAIHLLLASVTFAALVWIATSLKPATVAEHVPGWCRTLASVLVAVVFVQIGFGALVAGLRAGQAYNTWPLMDGALIPSHNLLGALTPLWRNLVDNIATVQFQHRMTAYLLLILAIVQAIGILRGAPGSSAARRSIAIVALITVQASIGIAVLLLVVPIWAGILHQLFAMLVLAMVIVHRQRLAASRAPLLCPPLGRAVPA